MMKSSRKTTIGMALFFGALLTLWGLERAGVRVDPKSYRPACNPKTLETNVRRLYVAGVVISGRHTNEIFIENGRFHGKQIIEDLQRH